MDIGAWDWSAIATFIISIIGGLASLFTACIAWRAYNQWNTQKASEVQSQEAKIILTMVLEFRTKFIHIHSQMLNQDMQLKDFSDDIQELKNITLTLSLQTDFFKDVLGQYPIEKTQTSIDRICVKHFKKIEAFCVNSWEQRIQDTTSRHLVTSFDQEIQSSKKQFVDYFLYKKPQN